MVPQAVPAFGASGVHTLLVALLAFAWLAATAWVRPLGLPDEGRYAGVALEMLRSGDWLTPTLNGLPFFHKPPLFYWITASSMSVLGVNEFAARAAPLVGATLAAISLFMFMRRWSGERAAWLALVALLVQPLLYIGGQFANLDMLAAGCITSTITLAAHAALCIELGLPHRKSLAMAFAMAAAGVLAKGLIGIVLPVLVLLPWLVLRRQWRVLGRMVWLPGLLLFALIAAPWFVAMQLRFPEFLHYFFVVQHFQRFAGGGFNNVQPFWFYPAVLALFSLPWLPWLRGAVSRGVVQGDARDTASGSIRLLWWLWVGVVTAFFSMPQSKLLGYILPAVPPLVALFAAGYERRATTNKNAARWWWACLAVTCAVSVGALGVLAKREMHSTRQLASALAAHAKRGEPIVMLGSYYYDVPFYAGLRLPVRVADNWRETRANQRDNWHKELADAGEFAPARAREWLVESAALPGALCAAPVSWVIGSMAEGAKYSLPGAAQLVASSQGVQLWRVDPAEPAVISALHCVQKPNAGSTSK
jgi:4-amino-4-deoxy-L-arabinose transferase-like glycosyltransferase